LGLLDFLLFHSLVGLLPDFFDVFGFVSLDSFLLCHWNHLGFVIVRLPERLSVQPAEQPDQQDDWNRNANQPK
jgi:hypothetical protein